MALSGSSLHESHVEGRPGFCDRLASTLTGELIHSVAAADSFVDSSDFQLSRNPSDL